MQCFFLYVAANALEFKTCYLIKSLCIEIHQLIYTHYHHHPLTPTQTHTRVTFFTICINLFPSIFKYLCFEEYQLNTCIHYYYFYYYFIIINPLLMKSVVAVVV